MRNHLFRVGILGPKLQLKPAQSTHSESSFLSAFQSFRLSPSANSSTQFVATATSAAATSAAAVRCCCYPTFNTRKCEFNPSLILNNSQIKN
jgi:hypothetical protein